MARHALPLIQIARGLAVRHYATRTYALHLSGNVLDALSTLQRARLLRRCMRWLRPEIVRKGHMQAIEKVAGSKRNEIVAYLASHLCREVVVEALMQHAEEARRGNQEEALKLVMYLAIDQSLLQ
nr:hypothetical protein [Dyella humicola]